MLDQPILVVGMGGIGCELLKNLVLSGFKNLTLVDLDSIDISNLNRQFLFTKEDVGKSKALVGASAVRKLLKPEQSAQLSINVHVSRVQELPLEVFTCQKLIINALDNFEARKYVNRICLGSDLPLIEAGSTGANGQVMPIWAAAGTECFECRDQPLQETYPVCTIRLTPEKPEHCIAWARYLFEALFGPQSDNNILSDIRDNLEFSAASSPNMPPAAESCPNMPPAAASCPNMPPEISYNEIHVCKYLFVTAIKELVDTGQFVKSGLQPLAAVPEKTPEGDFVISCNVPEAQNEHDDIQYYINMFLQATARLLTDRSNGIILTFDKDHDLCMNFVSAAANLRAETYGLPLTSLWRCKSIAGAIQPAITATNAIVAGLEVEQAMKLLKLILRNVIPTKQEFDDAGLRFIWVRGLRTGKFLLFPEKLDPPSKKCFICQQRRVRVKLRTLEEWTVGDFVDRVLKASMNLEKDIIVQNSESILYELDLIEDNPEWLKKRLPEAGFKTGVMLSVTGFSGVITLTFDAVLTEDSSVDEEHFKVEKANAVEESVVVNAEFYRKAAGTFSVEIEVEEDGERFTDDDFSRGSKQPGRKRGSSSQMKEGGGLKISRSE